MPRPRAPTPKSNRSPRRSSNRCKMRLSRRQRTNKSTMKRRSPSSKRPRLKNKLRAPRNNWRSPNQSSRMRSSRESWRRRTCRRRRRWSSGSGPTRRKKCPMRPMRWLKTWVRVRPSRSKRRVRLIIHLRSTRQTNKTPFMTSRERLRPSQWCRRGWITLTPPLKPLTERLTFRMPNSRKRTPWRQLRRPNRRRMKTSKRSSRGLSIKSLKLKQRSSDARSLVQRWKRDSMQKNRK